jgi:hypothetical protein
MSMPRPAREREQPVFVPHLGCHICTQAIDLGTRAGTTNFVTPTIVRLILVFSRTRVPSDPPMCLFRNGYCSVEVLSPCSCRHLDAFATFHSRSRGTKRHAPAKSGLPFVFGSGSRSLLLARQEQTASRLHQQLENAALVVQTPRWRRRHSRCLRSSRV